jgi:hypothetical protein
VLHTMLYTRWGRAQRTAVKIEYNACATCLYQLYQCSFHAAGTSFPPYVHPLHRPLLVNLRPATPVTLSCVPVQSLRRCDADPSLHLRRYSHSVVFVLTPPSLHLRRYSHSVVFVRTPPSLYLRRYSHSVVFVLTPPSLHLRRYSHRWWKDWSRTLTPQGSVEELKWRADFRAVDPPMGDEKRIAIDIPPASRRHTEL